MNQSAKQHSYISLNWSTNLLQLGLLAAAMFVMGCGTPDETELTSTIDLSAQPVVGNKELSDDQLAAELEQLEKEAIALESNGRKEDSALVRKKIHETISENVSPDSWQAKTAKQIADTAARNSQLAPKNERLLAASKQLLTEFQNQAKSGAHAAASATGSRIIGNFQQIYGENSLTVAETLIQIGNIEYRTRMTDAAIRHFHSAVQILKSLDLETHPQMEIAHTALGALYSRKKKFAPALANQKAATRIASRLWGDTSMKYADQANQLGVMYHAADQSDTALQILLASEVLRRKTLGDNDPKVGHSLLNIATVLKDLKRYDQAIPTFQRAKASFASHKQLGSLVEKCNLNLATIYMLQNNLPMAEQRLAEVVAGAELNQQANPVHIAACKYRYSIALAKQGKYDVAQPMMEQTLQIQRQQLGPTHSETVKTMKAYAMLLEATKQVAAARQVYNAIRQVSYESESSDFQR